MTEDTLPKLIMRNYHRWGDTKAAMRNKDFGIWITYTWKDYYEQVKYFALGLVSLGLESGDRVSLIGDNEPQWYWAEYATQSVGGAAVGIFVDCVPEEVEYIVKHSDSKFVVARDQEQTDKILAIRNNVPLVRNVIYWDYKGMWAYEDPFVKGWDEVIELGKEYEKTHPGFFEEMVERGNGNSPAIYCYTSGTTGLPKGAIVSHNNLIGTISNWFQVDPWYDTDEYLSYVAPAWITEQMLGIAGALVSGTVVDFPEEPETMTEDIREIGPRMLLYTSRLWESLCSEVQAKLEDANFMEKFLYKLLLPVGYKRADTQLERKQLNLFWRALVKIADGITFYYLRDKIGLSKTRAPYTGGALLAPEIFRWFRAIGIPLKQIYGSSECGLCCCHLGEDIKMESIGQPLPGMELRITKDSEVLWRGAGLFSNYYKNPEETEKARVDNWFHGGDAVYLDDEGHVIFLDRVKDLMELTDGSKYPAQFAEARLKFSPHIRDAIIVGGKERPFVSAIIQIDYAIAGKWAEDHHIAYTTFTDLSQKPQVYDLVYKDVTKLNNNLPASARIKRFVCIHKEFDPDEAELTRTRKLRRDYVENKYKDIIDSIYSGREEFEAESVVKYRDGRIGKTITKVQIRTLF